MASANRAFETLNWHQRTELSPLSGHSTLILKDRALNPQNKEESDANNFQARSKEALARSEAEYKKPKTNTQTQKIKPENQIPKLKKKKKSMSRA